MNLFLFINTIIKICILCVPSSKSIGTSKGVLKTLVAGWEDPSCIMYDIF